MLSALAIKNFAIIEDIRIEFAAGLSVLTGETGAGKSIIIEAVNLLLGSRASADLVRTGEDNAELEAFFEIEKTSHAAQVMEGQGMDPRDGLIIRRVISSSGKSRVYINSCQSTLDFLKQVTFNLASISSQHAHQGLLRQENHLDILDEFARTLDLRKAVSELYHKLLPLKKEILALELRQAAAQKELDLLKFQVDEVEGADIRPGEDEDLAIKREQLKNSAQIFETVNGAIHDIYDRDGALLERISSLSERFARFGTSDTRLKEISDRLDTVSFDLQDIISDLRGYADTIDLDPESLEQVDLRLDEISRLKRKYGGSLEALFDNYKTMAGELEENLGLGKKIAGLKKEQARLEGQIRQKSKALSMRRQKEGIVLADLAQKELAGLEMGRAKFEVAFSVVPSESPEDIATEAREKIFSTGMDRVGFLISPNPGEAPKPLAKVASGGELSRIVLALKAVLSQGQSFETLVFDEVDAGIGGATSEKVGLKLRELGDVHQVICITHLAQIARYGAHQFRIFKQVVNDRTATSIVPLTSRDERVEEIARMIGGKDITRATRAHARELLSTQGHRM
ncbi:MAG: DNA repair protein RecN [Desulfobacter sp.]|nr:DNA repair protein RecN [Desulfobacter sp.]WDP83903.1 MAG: DNA repair protein RecN [Desulfobacter sp.]